MTLSYEDIFKNFLGSVSDYQLATLDESDANLMMSEYLNKAMSKTYVRRIFKTFVMDNEIQTITCELKVTTTDDEDMDFLKDIIVKGMLVEWLEPQINKTSLLHQMITSSKEGTWFSQASHLSELKDLYNSSKLAIRQAIRDRGYIYNSYLEDK